MAIEAAKCTGTPALVICNNTAKEQWDFFIREQSAGAQVVVLGSAGRGEWEGLIGRGGGGVWVVVHYEAIQYIWWKLLNYPWKTVIVDEAHRIKNRRAKQTLYIKRIGNMDTRKIALTGTPMENHPGDLWSIINWLYPKAFSSYWTFAEQYVEFKQNWQGFRYPAGGKNLEQLSTIVAPFYLRRMMKDIRADLPDLLPPTTVWVDPEPAQEDLLSEMLNARDIETEVGGQVFVIPNALTKLVRAQQISSHPPILGLSAPCAKLDWLSDYIEDNPDETMLIFTKFRETCQHIAKKFNASYIIGGEDMTMTALDWFEGRKRLLVCTIAAGGASLNLQRANTVIFYDLEWSTILYDQALHRVYRIDIRDHKNVIRLVTNHSADELVLKALEHKWDNIRLVNEFIRLFADVGVGADSGVDGKGG